MLEGDPLPHRERLRIEEEQHAAVRRVARPYLDDFLVPRLSLAKLECVSDRPRGQVWRAESASRSLVVKLYAAGSAPIARRSAVLHDLLCGRGIELAPLVFRDLGSAACERGCVCLVYAWVEGRRPRPGDAPAEVCALANLARIHDVPPPVFAKLEVPGATLEGGARLPVAELERARETFSGDARSLAALLRTPFQRLRASDLARVESWSADVARGLDAAGLPDALLHGDYHGSNLIETEDGRLVTLDLDSALVGPFHRELGPALLRCLWGTTSRELDEIDLERLLAHPRLLVAERAYLEQAPAIAGDFWAEHRERLLVAAYLRTIARLALRSGMPGFYGLRKRARFRGQALRRWRNALAHLNARA